MQILFIGGFYPDEMESDIICASKAVLQTAANKLQWCLLRGLASLNNVKLMGLSAIFIPPFPLGYKHWFIKLDKVIESHSISSRYVSFLNIQGLKQLSRMRSLERATRSFAQLKSVESKVIIAYSSHSPILYAAMKAKEIDPTIHICLVVPDLPQFMNLGSKLSVLYKLLKNVDNKHFYRLNEKVDSYVLLTKEMGEKLKVKKRPSIVVEGIVGSWYFHKQKIVLNDSTVNKKIVYTGTLHEKFGVMHLIETFMQLHQENLILEICGSGEMEEAIKAHAMIDSRIRFFGQLSSEEAKSHQLAAAVLVNPRQNDDEFTKYSFPSKNLEYLLSGNPVVGYKLEGIPEEYNEFMIYADGSSTNALKEAILKALDISPQDCEKRMYRTLAFLQANKTEIMAAKRIHEMILSSLNQ